MPKITLLQIKDFEYKDEAHLDRLVQKHRDDLSKRITNLDKPQTIAAINAIAYNLVHLMREREKVKRQRAKLLVLPGGKKD